MGRTDYIVQAGIGFDLDRSSARKSISVFEGLATTLNNISAKKAKEGFEKTEKDYQDSMKEISEINKKADADLVSGVKASAKATQQALQATQPQKLTEAAKAKMSTDEIKLYESKFKQSMKGMSSSYSKFAKEAEKLGIKVRKSQKGFGSGQSVSDFAKKDVETRTRLVKLTERMMKDEKEKLAGIEKGTKAYENQLAEIEALATQHKSMKNLNDDIIQQEKTHQKVHRTTAKEERKAERKKITAQKRIMAGLRETIKHTQRLGQVAAMTAEKIAGGLKNAFVIGTAAATAFFYKMQPLAETVQEFEKTIINANSVFNVTKKELFEVSDTMVNFTLRYGVAAGEMAEGLYQLASAGLSASESQEVLQHTMKLAMATQGDHNALAKLTVQTIMGFGMTMEDSGMLVDKFAHSIQKSLIEWDDLASSVKFAMPFFVATGQSIDELLGGLEVLTNRALEAGIAGRGLRQALAQFAKHADDNSSALSKLGVEIMNSEGNMRALHEITLDAQEAFGDVTDLEALTAMLEDMNVRGATAFALLVQNADEFQGAVDNIQNSAGEATLMADIQQQSLSNQIQLVKNALLAPFLLADEVGEANDTLNEFTYRIGVLVKQFTEFFIITLPDGTQKLTEHSEALKLFVIDALEVAIDAVERMKEIFLESNSGLGTFTELLHMAVVPLNIMLNVLELLGPGALVWAVKLKVINSLLPITNMLHMIGLTLLYKKTVAIFGLSKQTQIYGWTQFFADKQVKALNLSIWGQVLAYGAAYTGLWMYDKQLKMFRMTMTGVMVSVGGIITMMMLAITMTGAWSDALMGLAIVMLLLNSTAMYKAYLGGFMALIPGPDPSDLLAPGLAIAATAITMGALIAAMFAFRSAGQAAFGNLGSAGMSSSNIPTSKLPTERLMDSGGVFTGGRMYDSAGPTTEHGMAVLQRGETVIPKTRNMLDGGLTLNIGGDIVTDDAEDFAERIAAVLPEALRKQKDIGGI